VPSELHWSHCYPSLVQMIRLPSPHLWPSPPFTGSQLSGEGAVGCWRGGTGRLGIPRIYDGIQGGKGFADRDLSRLIDVVDETPQSRRTQRGGETNRSWRGQPFWKRWKRQAGWQAKYGTGIRRIRVLPMLLSFSWTTSRPTQLVINLSFDCCVMRSRILPLSVLRWETQRWKCYRETARSSFDFRMAFQSWFVSNLARHSWW